MTTQAEIDQMAEAIRLAYARSTPEVAHWIESNPWYGMSDRRKVKWQIMAAEAIKRDGLRERIQKIIDDQACIPWDDGEPCCSHDDHDGFMWPEGAEQCNGASDLLPLLRAAMREGA